MAWKRKYRCKGCGYEAEIYEGAATISGYGTCIPVQNVRQKWKIQEKKNSGREEQFLLPHDHTTARLMSG